MKLNPIFSDNAVFAANRPISVFGSGKGYATIKFNGATVKVNSTEEFWCVELPKMKYGGPYTLEFSSETEEKTLHGIYVGEVLLCSGQSNMAFQIKSTNTNPEYYSETPSALRYVNIFGKDQPISWTVPDSTNVLDFSALGYIIGKECALREGVAVGVICCTMGASAIESWMPENTLSGIGIDIPIEEKFLDHYHEEYGQWNSDGFLYENRLMRMIPYTLSGVVWYQGESDASPAEGRVYCRELAELIRIWRRDFKNENLPFVIVQLADTESRIALGEGWCLIQKAQTEISSIVPNVYTVISRDVCETDDVHPQSKHALALRIADVVCEKII